MTFGERLSWLCGQNGVSRQELAQLLGVSYQMVSKFLRNESRIDIDKLVILSQRFNVTTDYLLGLSERPGADKWTLKVLAKIADRWSSNTEEMSDTIGAVALRRAIKEVKQIYKGD